MQILGTNEKYPFPAGLGLEAQFLYKSNNLLRLGLENIESFELKALKNETINCGIYVDHPLIIWVFDFGKGGLYDAPFDISLYDRQFIDLHNIENDQQRLAIDLHVIELNGHILKVFRRFTIHPELTLNFLSAVQNQFSNFSEILYEQKLTEIYQFPIENLKKKTKMYLAGV